MDPNNLVLEISSDEDGDWNDHGREVSDGGDDYNWFAELFGDGSDEVVVVSETEKPVKKLKLKSCSVELDDDCVVLDSDPNAPVDVRNDNSGNDDDDSDDVLVVSEKGQVACRDYPHSRHLCIKFPFSSTPNQSHCNQCYCYVCDSLAPCVYWGNGTASTDHCHATDKDEFWILERKIAKNGCKVVQSLTQLAPVDLQTSTPALAPALAPTQNQIPNSGLIHAPCTPANFKYPNFTSHYRNNILASRTKLHPDLASQLVLRATQEYNLGYRVHRPVFKRTGTDSVRVATTANQNLYRGNFGSPNRHLNYQVNGMLSRSSKSLPPNAAKTSQYPSITSLTVNPQQPQVCNQPNPIFQSHVNSNQPHETMCYRQPHLGPPLSFRPQPALVQPNYAVQAQPSYPVPSRTPSPGPDFSHNFSQGNQAQSLIAADTGFKDYGLGCPAGQGSATPDSTNNSSLAGGLADYHQYDWIFDDQPIEPGFTDYSSDSTFIDTGPIFDF
ncbi:hypothetical protein R6Q59_028691 [Mikania micrantha]